MEAIVAGHLCLDLAPGFGVGGDRRPFRFLRGQLLHVGAPIVATGGAVPNVGLALARLGIRTRLVARVGRDVFGEMACRRLRECGALVDLCLTVDRNRHTGFAVVLSPGRADRMFLAHTGANDGFSGGDVTSAMLRGARLLHLGYPPLVRRMALRGGYEARAVFRRAKEHGLTTSLDMSLPDPGERKTPTDWSRWLRNVLPYVDVFLPSWEEATHMAGMGRCSLCARRLADVAGRFLGQGAAVAGIKLGDRGLYLRTARSSQRIRDMGACAPANTSAWVGRELLAPCYRVRVAGTTGAGDATFAGFLYALLNGASLEESADLAVALGSFCVEAVDAASGIPGPARLRQRVRSGAPRLPVRIALPGWRRRRGGAVWETERSTS